MKIISNNPQFLKDLDEMQEFFPNLSVIEIDKAASINAEKDLQTKIYVSENYETVDLIQNIVDSKYRVLIHKENPDFLRDIKRSAMICANQSDYFLQPEKVLFQKPHQIVKIPFETTVDKANALTAVDNYCQLLNSSFLTESLQTIFEELFMNAVFDAPREAGILEDFIPAELLIGHDENSVAISCLDRYGSLRPEKFFSRMLQVEKHGAGQVMNMDTSIGGAGIGSSILFGCSATLVVGVSPGKLTRVTCILPLKTSRKRFSQIKKNIQVVIQQD
ncbi:MAG: hypothetical protein ACXVCY_00310 [Pseudobdellovibrionaceae bacterium]